MVRMNRLILPLGVIATVIIILCYTYMSSPQRNHYVQSGVYKEFIDQRESEYFNKGRGDTPVPFNKLSKMLDSWIDSSPPSHNFTEKTNLPVVRSHQTNPLSSNMSSLSSSRLSTYHPENTPQITHELCSPKINIVLVKTHKSGSTTLANILCRFGDVNNLKFILPRSGHQLGWPGKFVTGMALPVVGTPNIIAHHSRYNEGVIPNLMPSNTVYIGIYRYPPTQFESFFKYYGHVNSYGLENVDNPIEQFMSNTQKYVKSWYDPLFGVSTHSPQNTQIFDYGYDIKTDADLERVVKLMEKRFSLIFIAEYFDESLILLKELMCWTMSDIIYISINARSDKGKITLNPTLEDKLLEWNHIDAVIYNHFNTTLWHKIHSYGTDKMREEVAILREKKKEWQDHCVVGRTEHPKSGYMGVLSPGSSHVMSYELTADGKTDPICFRMIIPERNYADYLRKKQYENILIENFPPF